MLVNTSVKKDDRRNALALENDSKNYAKLPQLKNVNFKKERIACSRIRLFKVMIDSSIVEITNTVQQLIIVETFNHVQSYLKKEPLQAISGIALTNSNYLKAKDSLNQPDFVTHIL